MARDIGDYFDRMTKRAKGGRRLDADDIDEPQSDTTGEPAPEPPSGGLGDMLKDILRKGLDLEPLPGDLLAVHGELAAPRFARGAAAFTPSPTLEA